MEAFAFTPALAIANWAALLSFWCHAAGRFEPLCVQHVLRNTVTAYIGKHLCIGSLFNYRHLDPQRVWREAPRSR